jgi:hypothetical protein
MKIATYLVVSLALVVCVDSGCAPTVQGDIFAGLEDVLSSAEPISTFDGEWLSDQYAYAMKITNRTGIVTLANSAVSKVGDVILVIASVDNLRFNGRHIFSNGSIKDVIGLLVSEDALLLSGGGLSWTLRRINTVNHRPVVDAGLDRSVRLADGPVFLGGEVTDDGLPHQTLTTKWTALSDPEGVSFADANSVDTTASFTQVGSYQFQLEASDGELSASDKMMIIVR